jgi:hypothetical protein
MLVIDTSMILDAIAVHEPAPGLTERLSEDGDLHALSEPAADSEALELMIAA